MSAILDSSGAERSADAPPSVPVDTHVHLHPDFDLELSFDRAASHFGGRSGCLVVASLGADDDPLGLLRERAASFAHWRLREADGGGVLERSGLESPIAIVPARQLVTAERLEVLALSTSSALAFGRPLDETLEAIWGAGAIAVVPWSFGKWAGKRGTALRKSWVARASDTECDPERALFLGDSGLRPPVLRAPLLEASAEGPSIGAPALILAGSDPLAMPGHEERVGSFGSLLPGPIDLERPQAWLSRSLRALRETPEIYGTRRRLGEFTTSIRRALSCRSGG